MRLRLRLIVWALTLLAAVIPPAAAQAEPIRYELQPTSTILVGAETSPLSGFLSLEGRFTLCGPTVGCPYRGYAVVDIQLSGGGIELSRRAIPPPSFYRLPGLAEIRDDEGSAVRAFILLESNLVSEGLVSRGVGFKDWRVLVLTVDALGTESTFVYPRTDSEFPSSLVLFLGVEEQTIRQTFDAIPDDGLVYLGRYTVTSSNVEAFATIRAEAVPESGAAPSLVIGLLVLGATRHSGRHLRTRALSQFEFESAKK